MWSILTMTILLLAGFGMYSDIPKRTVGLYVDVDESPAAPAQGATGFMDLLAREHGSVIEDENDDASLDPDID